MTMQPRLFPPLVLTVCVFLLACAGPPPAPSAEQYFTDAKNSLRSLDFDTALKNLDRMIKAAGGQPIAQQGLVLRTALLTALSDASKQMAEAYGLGVNQPPAVGRQGEFSRMRADYYGISRTRLMDAMQALMGQRSKLGDKPLSLQISFPEFSGTEPPELAKIRAGYWMEDNNRFRAELEMDRNALARTLARLAGAGGDVNKGREMFAKGSVEIDARIYLFELSNTFESLSGIFDRRALDDPRYLRICNEVIRDNMDLAMKLLAAKPDKDLQARVKKLKAECEKQLKTLSAAS